MALYNHQRMKCFMCDSNDCAHVADRAGNLDAEQRLRLNNQLIARENKRLQEELEKMKRDKSVQLVPVNLGVGNATTIAISNGTATAISIPELVHDSIWGFSNGCDEPQKKYDKRLLLVN